LSLKIKEYQHNYHTERANVVAKAQSAWSQVEAIAASADLQINAAIAKSALNRFQTQAVDGYDLLILEAISRAGAGQVRVITDDMDYATVPNIQVFTSNRNVIQEHLNKASYCAARHTWPRLGYQDLSRSEFRKDELYNHITGLAGLDPSLRRRCINLCQSKVSAVKITSYPKFTPK
jgi:Ran GTPase-activating protein (RanGAP) involved in mRNA processing and transport